MDLREGTRHQNVARLLCQRQPAIIVECIRTLKERDIPHSDIDAVFTICEEVGLLGAKHLDLEGIRSRYGLVLDSDDIGYLFTKAPAADHMEFVVHGLESHAGVAPENGISAIQIAAEAIANMKLGRIDHETKLWNFGVTLFHKGELSWLWLDRDLHNIETSSGIEVPLLYGLLAEIRLDYDRNGLNIPGTDNTDIEWVFALGYKW